MSLAITILQKELAGFQKAKRKSIQCHQAGLIDDELHKTHIKNLNPKIEELSEAIKKLKS